MGNLAQSCILPRGTRVVNAIAPWTHLGHLPSLGRHPLFPSFPLNTSFHSFLYRPFTSLLSDVGKEKIKDDACYLSLLILQTSIQSFISLLLSSALPSYPLFVSSNVSFFFCYSVLSPPLCLFPCFNINVYFPSSLSPLPSVFYHLFTSLFALLFPCSHPLHFTLVLPRMLPSVPLFLLSALFVCSFLPSFCFPVL